MDTVASLGADERGLLFRETGARMGVAPWVAEKDFWVCWVLSKLFDLPPTHPSLLFKGGTSLSKVFGIIRRFSEDIDLSVDRADLGYVADRDPELVTGKGRRRLLEQLTADTVEYVRRDLQPTLSDRFERVLGGASWSLEVDESNLVFTYPSSTSPSETGYASQSVLLEIGARSDHSPAGLHPVHPYAYDYFPNYFSTPTWEVRVLEPARTFWEKATILHAHHHGGPERATRRNLARHYYDLHCLAESDVGRDALDRLDLLDRVATHKAIFFPAAWARYDEARAGTIRLVPGRDVAAAVSADYDRMIRSGFFYGEEPPTWEAISETLGALESGINGA